MIDKGKYSSHGTLMRKMPGMGLAKWQKPKLAVINPLGSTVARQKYYQFKQKRQDMTLITKSFNSAFKFQQPIHHPPIQQNLIQPFLYIQKLIKKTKVDDKQWKDLKPFVASAKIKQSIKTNHKTNHKSGQVPEGYDNLFDYQEDKRITAEKVFKKLLDIDVTNIKEMFLMTHQRIDLKHNPQINIKQTEFIEFMKQLVHQMLTQKQIKHFFNLYKNKTPTYTVKTPTNKDKSVLKTSNKDQVDKNNQRIDKINERTNQKIDKNNQRKAAPQFTNIGVDVISIKTLSFNYQKYLKSEVQISNLMSQKALKQRYSWVKRYLSIFNQNYSELKEAMNHIRAYQQSIRQHFGSMYKSYSNPYQHQIQQLKLQLQRPIIKYDKHKKDQITDRINELQQQNKRMYEKITQQYQVFISLYQEVILKNHDLFFNKRTICKLILPILQRTQYVNKEQLQKQMETQQQIKQQYIECLSDIVVEIDQDKKYLNQDCFTLADLVEMVLMRFTKNKKTSKAKTKAIPNRQQPKFDQQFTIKSLKKLTKQIKKQYLLKHQLFVQDIDEFPADQQIPMSLLHTCFQMQCTKVLAKSHIWSELINLIPQNQKKCNYHERKISCNQCLGYLKKYFIKLDENSCIQREKSKKISLLIENANLTSLWYYISIIQKVNNKLENYNQDDDDQEEVDDHVESLQTIQPNKEKRVGFADIAALAIQKQNDQKYFRRGSQDFTQNQMKHSQNLIVKDILKSIFNRQQPSIKEKKKQDKDNGIVSATSMLFNSNIGKSRKSDIPQSLQALKTLSKSFFMPQKDKKLTTNAFDIRFYQKICSQQPQKQQIIRLGTSMLLSHLPQPNNLQLSSVDPLKLSHYLSKNIDSLVQQDKKIIRQKHYQQHVRQGIDNNYFRDKIKLENRPTRYDSQGKGKYSVILPVGYYQGIIANQDQNSKQDKWFLRSHHVQTLTQNPLSKKDNVIHTEYQSKLDRVKLAKRPDEHVIEANVQRKDNLIQSLQERLQSLKANLSSAQRNRNSNGQKVPNAMLNNYLSAISDGKQDKDLEIAAYEACLYDLRRNQRNMVVGYRDQRNHMQGEPEAKWWEKKDSSFNNQLKKERIMVQDSFRNDSPHKKYVDKLKNRQIY